MKTETKNAGLYELEKQINARLASMPADKRPEASTRRRIQSVAYSSRGYFETTDSDGHIDHMSVDQAGKLFA